MMNNSNVRGVLWSLMLCALALVVVLIWSSVLAIRFDQAIEGYLKQAADSNTVPHARERLDIALRNIEKWNLTSGSSHVLWMTPKHDIGFWYENLKAARQDLDTVTEESTPLERSNVLMKLRETILDNGNDGTCVTAPPNISIHPHVGVVWVFCWLSLLGITVSFVILVIRY